MARLFVAVWPPEELVADLTGLPRKKDRGTTWVEPHNWHVTLRFFGDADPDDVTERLDQLEFSPATARYGPGVDIFKERVIIVPVAGVDELAAQVENATADLGTHPPRSRFHGHLTLGRLKGRARVPNVIGALVRAEQPVGAISLVESRLRPEGPIYEVLASWPVAAGFEGDLLLGGGP